MNIEQIKKEYSSEISEKQITTEFLNKNKISDKLIKAELYLQNIYGDKIDISKDLKTIDANQKKITKISTTDIAFNKDLKRICEEIDDSEVDDILSELKF